VVDEETSLKISAELPGIAKEDLEVALESGVLVLRGHKRNREESRENGIYRSERYYGYFERSVPLPEDVDPEKAEATYEHGVLTIRVPKTELRSAARRIPIRAAAS
jgi:HSP20 family protein